MSTNLIPIAISSQLDVTGEEKIHAANYELVIRPQWAPPPAPDASIYIALNNALTLGVSVDGAATFTDTPATGVIASSVNNVGATDGRLYHWSQPAATNNTFTTTDYTNFTRTTGISGFSGTLTTNLIKTSTEWQLYVVNSANYAYYSTDGVAFSMRTFTSGAVRRPVQFGTKLLGIAISAGNALAVSTDEGVTFASYTITGFNTSNGIQSVAVTPSGNFVIFGRNTSNILTIGRSATGLSGSWTVEAGPVSTTAHPVYSAVTPAGRIVFVLSDGRTYYSDNEGVSWTAGAVVPFNSPPSVSTTTATPAHKFVYAPTTGAFLITTEQGGGVNRLYKSTDSTDSWTLMYTTPSTAPINGIVEV